MTKRRIKPFYIIVPTILVLAIAGFLSWHAFHKSYGATTTSKEPTAQNNFAGGNERPNGSADSNQGGAKDNNGDSAASQDDVGTLSASGIIGIVAPSSGGTLASGDILRGTAKDLSQVQYRIVDDKVGVVAQGSLTVVNGTYSGTVYFTPHSQTGSLDVFNYNAQGQEVNEVEIPVTLGS